MSKRQFSQFLNDLKRAELQEQLVDLYGRFKNVKEFYDFSFNPNEDKRFDLAKQKIKKEYFPENSRKPKKRRSVAQKQIVQFQKLEADPTRIADLMLYNLETAQSYLLENTINQFSFYKSMLNSFTEAANFIVNEHLLMEFKPRLLEINSFAQEHDWENKQAFNFVLESLVDQ